MRIRVRAIGIDAPRIRTKPGTPDSEHRRRHRNARPTRQSEITRTMQIPLSYAEDIIGGGGKNIAYIRRASGAIVTLQESRGLTDEMIIEIKGTSSQVQTAQQLVHRVCHFMQEQMEGL